MVKQTNWWNTAEVQQAVKEEAFQIWFHQKDDQSRLMSVHGGAKLAVKAAEERFGKRLEMEHRSANKTFWQTIHRIGGKKVGGVGQVKSKNGILLSDKKSILCR